MKKQRAFTLMEFLIVITIIVILGTTFSSCLRENARRASCQNNFKQLGFGILPFGQDDEEKSPLS